MKYFKCLLADFFPFYTIFFFTCNMSLTSLVNLNTLKNNFTRIAPSLLSHLSLAFSSDRVYLQSMLNQLLHPSTPCISYYSPGEESQEMSSESPATAVITIKMVAPRRNLRTFGCIHMGCFYRKKHV